MKKKTIPKIRANANSPLIASLPDTLTPNMYSRVICKPVVNDVLMSFLSYFEKIAHMSVV